MTNARLAYASGGKRFVRPNCRDRPGRAPNEPDMDITQLTDEQLIAETRGSASRLSFYNAAEGANYRNEAVGRAFAQSRYRECREELERRGIELVFEPGEYLL